MARRTKAEIMEGVEHTSSRIIDNNTVEYMRENGERVIRLHLTDIVTYKTDGTIELNTGGWTTVTTKDRINKQLAEHAPGWSVWQERNVWYLSHGWYGSPNCGRYHYHDHIIISADRETCDGKPYDKEAVKKANAWQRKVRAYAKKFVETLKAGEVPAPGPGDCWMCCMVDTKNRAWGESGHDDHIYSHICEKYYVPSLVLRAIDQFGVSQAARWCLTSVWQEDWEHGNTWFTDIGWEQIEKSIYRYCLQWAPYNEDTIKRAEEEVA